MRRVRQLVKKIFLTNYNKTRFRNKLTGLDAITINIWVIKLK